MTKYQLQWTDDVESSPEIEARIVDLEDGTHTYTFETGSQDDAEAVVTTFMRLNPQHNFDNHTITALAEEDQ